MSKQLKISPIQVTSSNVVEEELEIPGGKVSFTTRFFEASKMTRRPFPEPQPFTAPNFPPNTTPQYKPAPHAPPCSRQSPSFRGQPLQAEGQAETPLLLSARFLLGTLLVNHKAATNRAPYKKKKKEKISLLIHPREIQSKSSITALHKAQTSITIFTQIPSQIHG